MTDRAIHGKRRAKPRRFLLGRKRGPAGRRADRPENHEGITPEFLRKMREVETEPPTPPVHNGPGIRDLLAGIDEDLRADQIYQQALSQLAFGRTTQS